MSRGLEDLYGLFYFLHVAPYGERHFWQTVLQRPYTAGCPAGAPLSLLTSDHYPVDCQALQLMRSHDHYPPCGLHGWMPKLPYYITPLPNVRRSYPERQAAQRAPLWHSLMQVPYMASCPSAVLMLLPAARRCTSLDALYLLVYLCALCECSQHTHCSYFLHMYHPVSGL